MDFTGVSTLMKMGRKCECDSAEVYTISSSYLYEFYVMIFQYAWGPLRTYGFIRAISSFPVEQQTYFLIAIGNWLVINPPVWLAHLLPDAPFAFQCSCCYANGTNICTKSFSLLRWTSAKGQIWGQPGKTQDHDLTLKHAHQRRRKRQQNVRTSKQCFIRPFGV